MSSFSQAVNKAALQIRAMVRAEQTVLGVLALIAGGLVAGGIILMREAIDHLHAVAWLFSDSHSVAETAALMPWWQVVLIPTGGGLVVALFYRFLMPGGQPQAVAHVIEVSELKGGRMSLLTGLGAATGSILSIGFGASVGREGPAVHLGASICAWIARTLHFAAPMARTLLGCGVAAAVAASFNAPIAGALFAHEVVIGHYALSALAPVVLASVTATIITHQYFGNFPAFTVPEFALKSLWEFPLVLVLGVLGGLVAVALMRGIFLAEGTMAKARIPDLWRPPLAGFLIGVLALAFPQVLGVGYEVTDGALSGDFALGLLLALLLAKIFATSVCLGGGFGGGVFSPSLAVGAILGSAFGLTAAYLFPGLDPHGGAYALIGMGAVASAVLGAPVSTILILFELTADYGLTVSAMIAVVTANVISHTLVKQHSFFHWQLERRGVFLKKESGPAALRQIRVTEVVRPDTETVRAEQSLEEVRDKLPWVSFGELYVVGDKERYWGLITLAELGDLVADTSVDDLVNAFDLAYRDFPALEADDTLERALVVMEAEGVERLPVVDNFDTRRLVGCIYKSNILETHNQVLMEKHK